MGNTRGIHWIVTTHGSWLHGDVRGSWLNGKIIDADPFLEETIRARMAADAVVLDRVEMMAVAAEFGSVVRERRVIVHAATVQATHAHVVFAPMADDIGDVIAACKYRAASVVMACRRRMHRPIGRSLWSEGQFPVFIYSDEHLRNAIAYVRDHNRRVGRVGDPYDWITPWV